MPDESTHSPSSAEEKLESRDETTEKHILSHVDDDYSVSEQITTSCPKNDSSDSEIDAAIKDIEKWPQRMNLVAVVRSSVSPTVESNADANEGIRKTDVEGNIVKSSDESVVDKQCLPTVENDSTVNDGDTPSSIPQEHTRPSLSDTLPTCNTIYQNDPALIEVSALAYSSPNNDDEILTPMDAESPNCHFEVADPEVDQESVISSSTTNMNVDRNTDDMNQVTTTTAVHNSSCDMVTETTITTEEESHDCSEKEIHVSDMTNNVVAKKDILHNGIRKEQSSENIPPSITITSAEDCFEEIVVEEASDNVEKKDETVHCATVDTATSTHDEAQGMDDDIDIPRPPPRRPSIMKKTHSHSASISSKVSTYSDHSAATVTPIRNSRPRLVFPETRSQTLSRNNSLNIVRGSQTHKKKKMFSWLTGDNSKKKNKEVLESVSDGLKKIYKQKLYPLEDHYKFHEFHSPALDDPDFDAKPMILLVGQYSTGKTTFIRHLLEKDFPGIRIGPEPTTDRFIAVMHSNEDGVIPGNALVVDSKKQFRALSGFGNAFLNRFQCSSMNNQVLESITIVDTPGILSGEKQRIDRGYDFTGVLEWFAERVDRIILLFDAHKLDISDEFKRCIEALSGNEDKIRIVLNKSDMVDHQQLMRVYGALMWSLGKVFRTPEVSRVYLGSFWDQPLHYDINRRLFQDEQHDLFQDLQGLPRNAALRKLNDLIKRARLAKVHAYIIAELRKQMPSMIGKDKKKKDLIQNLDKIFEQIQREHNISPGDFPDVNKMREKLQNHDFTKFNPINKKLLDVVDGMLASDIARLMGQIPQEEAAQARMNGDGVAADQPTVRGGAFSQATEAETPFGFGRGEGFDKGANENEWVVSRERTQNDTTFDSLGPVNGFINGRSAKEHMMKSKLPNAVLGKIWKLADVDKDGQLDADEFALANYLINLKLEGHELPAELPTHLVPPSKREAETVYPKLDEDDE